MVLAETLVLGHCQPSYNPFVVDWVKGTSQLNSWTPNSDFALLDFGETYLAKSSDIPVQLKAELCLVVTGYR